MAIPVTAKPTYPNVPPAPGVPSIIRRVGAVQNTAVNVVADALIVLRMFQLSRWGIFSQGGFPIVVANSVADFEFRRDKRISDFPQENGAFASYNKVSTPFQGRLTFLQSGLDLERTLMLQSIERAQASLELYVLVMPEFSYPNVNVVHHDFRRTARKGVTLLAVDVWVEEVRITGSAQFTKTAAPSGANTVNGGTVTPATPTADQANGLPANAIT